ncbi:hypothetical protein M9Y10_031766, partial [Tritrichomonas musculus]
MESYIEDKKNLYASILEFLEESKDDNDGEVMTESFQQLITVIKSQHIEENAEEMRQFLEIIKSIGLHHHRDQHFNEKMNQLLIRYKDQIKQTLSNLEIFRIFENNKKIVLFLLQNELITISNEIYKEILNKIEKNGNRYWHFFIPELEKFIGEEKMAFIKSELLKKDPTFFTNYEEKREKGENDSYICSLIREDSVKEFITYVNRHNISPSNQILPSIFETNLFLIEQENTTLIEYSAFFGSIQIYRYLLMNKAEMKPRLWLYSIHSKNAELIHLVESLEISPPTNYEECLMESIKCHHNDIACYIENNLIDQEEKYYQQNEELISNCIKYHNYSHFEKDNIIEHGFFYLCFYHYDKLFGLLLKKKEKLIEGKLKQYPNIRSASKNNEIEV